MPVAELSHSMLGRVVVNIRQNSQHISARWKQGHVSVNIPQGTPISQLHKALDSFTPHLLASRPEVAYHHDQRLNFPYFDVLIQRQNHIPDKILCTPKLPTIIIGVGSNFNFDRESTSHAISDMMCKAAKIVAAQVLIPRARELATRIGRAPLGWTISSGHRVLGRCSSTGFIALSYVLVYLPAHLSDYVILHELAHLSEMNHSTRFHQRLNEHCGGREAELVAQLKSYRRPVLRR